MARLLRGRVAGLRPAAGPPPLRQEERPADAGHEGRRRGGSDHSAFRGFELRMGIKNKALVRQDALKDSIADALSDPAPDGDLRAFAVGDLTCVVQWRPTPACGR